MEFLQIICRAALKTCLSWWVESFPLTYSMGVGSLSHVYFVVQKNRFACATVGRSPDSIQQLLMLVLSLWRRNCWQFSFRFSANGTFSEKIVCDQTCLLSMSCFLLYLGEVPIVACNHPVHQYNCIACVSYRIYEIWFYPFFFRVKINEMFSTLSDLFIGVTQV